MSVDDDWLEAFSLDDAEAGHRRVDDIKLAEDSWLGQVEVDDADPIGAWLAGASLDNEERRVWLDNSLVEDG